MNIAGFIKNYTVSNKYNFKYNQKVGKEYENIEILHSKHPHPVVFEDGWSIESASAINITSPLIIGDNVTITACTHIKLKNIISIGNNVKIISQSGYGEIILDTTNVDTEFETFKTKIGDNLTVSTSGGEEVLMHSGGDIIISSEDTSYIKTCNFESKRIIIKGGLSTIDDDIIKRCSCVEFTVDNYNYINTPTNINICTDIKVRLDAIGIASGSKIKVGTFVYNEYNDTTPTGVIGNNVNIKTNKDIMLYVHSIGKNVKLQSDVSIVICELTTLPDDICIDTDILKCKCVSKFNTKSKTIKARNVYLGNIVNLPSYFMPAAIGESNEDSIKYLDIQSIRSIPSTFPLHADCKLTIGNLDVFDRHFPTSISGSLELSISHLPSNFNVNIGGSLNLTTYSIAGKFAPKVGGDIYIHRSITSLGDKFIPECNGTLQIGTNSALNANIFAPKCDTIVINTTKLQANIDGVVCNKFHANNLINVETDFSKCDIKEELSLNNACVSTSCDFITRYIPVINISRAKIGVGYKFNPKCFVLHWHNTHSNICSKKLPFNKQLERLSQAKIVNMIKIPTLSSDIDFEKYNISDKYKLTTSDTLVNNRLNNIVEVLNKTTTVVTYCDMTYCIADGITSVVINRDDNARVLKVKNVNDGSLKYIVYDDEYSAHGSTIKKAMADLIYKTSKRNISDYKKVDVDDEFTIVEMYAMYRTITGSCNSGTKAFMDDHGIDFEDERMITPNDIINGNSKVWGDIFNKNMYGKTRFTEYFKNKN